MASDDKGRQEKQRLNRRQLLGIGSGLAFTGLAGCLGGTGGGGTPTDSPETSATGAGETTSAGETSAAGGTTSAGGTTGAGETSAGGDTTGENGTDATSGTSAGNLVEPLANVSLAWSYPPSEVNLNALTSTGNRPNPAGVVWWENEAHWSHGAREYVNFLLAEPPSVDGCEATYTYRDDYTWWDGTPVNTEDAMMAYRMNAYFNFGGPDNTDVSYEAVDDYTLRKTVGGPIPETVAKLTHTNHINVFKADYWQSWLEQYEDASSEDAVTSITEELTNTTITIQEMVDEGLGNGLYKPTEWDPTKVLNEKYEDHPYASETNLQQFQWNILADNQKFQQAFTSNNLDWDRNPSRWQQKVDQPPEGIEVMDTYSFLGGPKLTINWRNKHLARRGVRRALAYLMPSESIKQVVRQGFGKPVVIPGKLCTGLVRSMEKEWLGEEFRNNVIDYGHASQTEKATQAMENAGYTKEGGSWVGPDGDAIQELRYVNPGWGPWPTAAETVSEVFNDFGIPNQQSVPESGTWGKITNETYNFDLNMFVEGTNDPFPSRYLRIDAQNGFGQYTDAVANFPEVEGCSSEVPAPELSSDTSPVFNHPLNPAPEFPTTVGQTDLSGETERFKPFQWVRGMNNTTDTERIKELARKCSWYHNFNAVHIGVFNGAGGKWGDTANFQFPDEGDSSLTMGAAEYLLPKGKVSTKTE